MDKHILEYSLKLRKDFEDAVEAMTNVKALCLGKMLDLKDKGGESLAMHPWRMAEKIEAETYGRFGYFGEEHSDITEHDLFMAKVITVAWGHDLLEDTDTTVEDLKEAGCSEDVIEAIVRATRKKDEFYSEYIKRVYENRISRIVKIYDLEDNMDIRRLRTITLKKHDLNRMYKYHNAWKYLKGYKTTFGIEDLKLV